MRGSLLLACLLLLAGCWETRQTASTVEIERTQGIRAGQPEDLTTTRRREVASQSQVQMDLSPIVEKAVALATGDLRRALGDLATRPAVAPTDLAALEAKLTTTVQATQSKPLTGSTSSDLLLAPLLALIGAGGLQALKRKMTSKS